jgi:hypothetical protein
MQKPGSRNGALLGIVWEQDQAGGSWMKSVAAEVAAYLKDAKV